MMILREKPGSQDEHWPRHVAGRKTQAENTAIINMILLTKTMIMMMAMEVLPFVRMMIVNFMMNVVDDDESTMTMMNQQ